MSLEEVVRLWRGQVPDDDRPNKALNPDHLEWLLHGYPLQEVVLRTARHGVAHAFQRDTAGIDSRTQYSNHKSAQVYENALHRSIREGQDAGTYLVIDVDAAKNWNNIRVSPFGCVPKADVDPHVEARVIHNLSSPVGDSTNAMTDVT